MELLVATGFMSASIESPLQSTVFCSTVIGHEAAPWQCNHAYMRALVMAPGLLGFPPKELQYRFLAGFTPVFYIRQRDYSKVCCGLDWQITVQSASQLLSSIRYAPSSTG